MERNISIGKNPYVEQMSVRIEQRNLHLTDVYKRQKVESQLDRDGHDPQNKLQPLEPVEDR